MIASQYKACGSELVLPPHQESPPWRGVLTGLRRVGVPTSTQPQAEFSSRVGAGPNNHRNSNFSQLNGDDGRMHEERDLVGNDGVAIDCSGRATGGAA